LCDSLTKSLVWIWFFSAEGLTTTIVEIKKNVNYHNILLSSQNDKTGPVVV